MTPKEMTTYSFFLWEPWLIQSRGWTLLRVWKLVNGYVAVWDCFTQMWEMCPGLHMGLQDGFSLWFSFSTSGLAWITNAFYCKRSYRKLRSSHMKFYDNVNCCISWFPCFCRERWGFGEINRERWQNVIRCSGIQMLAAWNRSSRK